MAYHLDHLVQGLLPPGQLFRAVGSQSPLQELAFELLERGQVDGDGFAFPVPPEEAPRTGGQLGFLQEARQVGFGLLFPVLCLPEEIVSHQALAQAVTEEDLEFLGREFDKDSGNRRIDRGEGRDRESPLLAREYP